MHTNSSTATRDTAVTDQAAQLSHDIASLGLSLDRLIEERALLLASVREFVAMYDGLDDAIGMSVKGKITRARAALARADRGRA